MAKIGVILPKLPKIYPSGFRNRVTLVRIEVNLTIGSELFLVYPDIDGSARSTELAPGAAQETHPDVQATGLGRSAEGGSGPGHRGLQR